jgi:MFS family permease
MIAMLSLVSLGSLLINFANTSSSFMAYMSVIVLGLGMSGLLTASLYLVNEYSTAESRGFITGIQTLFGVVGILFQTIIGALLYEYVSRSGPFNYFAATALVILVITIYIYRNRKQELTNNLVEEGSIIEQEKPEPDSNNLPSA